ncbi:transglutaminase-like domain-containing protein [Viridibacillus sp. FSL R5-0888]|uniref:transglutaminase-like domain-containing protein n=1 Tax=Viridibacillus sp. FSL R5-0888 TaxID=2921663 RepID=UPI004040C293
MIKTYKYSSHLSGRGVAVFKERKKGDCGEFGAIFCSYCRAIDIPARMLYGTWILKKFSPHAWSEIYIENEGWIPVDPYGEDENVFTPIYKYIISYTLWSFPK